MPETDVKTHEAEFADWWARTNQDEDPHSNYTFGEQVWKAARGDKATQEDDTSAAVTSDEHGKTYDSIGKLLAARVAGDVELQANGSAQIIDGELYLYAEGCSLPVYRQQLDRVVAEFCALIGVTVAE